MSEQNVTLVRRLFEGLWNNRDLTLADQLISSDHRNIDPGTPDLGVGPEGVRKLVTLYTTAFPDLHLAIDEIVDGGDRVVVVAWTGTGTHNGDLQGIAPTGRKFKITGTTISHITNGKISQDRVNWDTFGMMQQLGVIAKTEKRAA